MSSSVDFDPPPPPTPSFPTAISEATTSADAQGQPSTQQTQVTDALITCTECGSSISASSFSHHLSSHYQDKLASAEEQVQRLREDATIQATKLAKIEQDREAALDAVAEATKEKTDLQASLRAAQKQATLTSQSSFGTMNNNTNDAAYGDGPANYGATKQASSPISALSTSELSSLSLAFFPELEPLLGSIPPVPSEHVFTAASVYLYDSFHCRSIKHSTEMDALIAYKFIHVSKWKSFVRWVGWFHILLGFIEPPSSIMVNGTRYGPSHAAAGAIELLFLGVYTYHAIKQWQAYGPGAKGYWRSPWRTAKLFVLAICFVDVIVSMARNLDSPSIHLSQILRVFFVLEQSGRMRQLCSCILKSMPQIISIMFLCLIHIFAFGVVGFLFIGPLEENTQLPDHDGKLYFSSLGRSFLSTFILLTSENFPEVMLPSYRKHWFVCIYFVPAVLIGLYGLLQLTTAVVFHSFQLHTKSKLQRALHYRERALQASFTLLSEYTCGDGFMELSTWEKLLQKIRPDWTEKQAEILFRAATGVKGHEEEGDGTEEQKSSSSSPSAEQPKLTMDFLQFEQIVRFTQKSFQFEFSGANSASHKPAQSHGAASNVTLNPSDSSSLTPSASTGASHGIKMDRLDGEASVDSSVSIQAGTGGSGAVHSHQAHAHGRSCHGLYNTLVWYYTYRIPLPYLLRRLIGRTEEYITDMEAEERAEREEADAPEPHPISPLHPIRSVRVHLETTSLCELVADLLVLIHAVLLVVRMVLHDDVGASDATLNAMEVFVILLEVQFLGEVLSKLWICGPRSFFKSKLQMLDFFTILCVWIGQILVFSETHGSAHAAISCLRLARCFRLYHRLGSFTLLLKVLGQVGPPLAALFGCLFILLYTYSMFGMMFFVNELVLGNPGLDTTDYDDGDFYCLNFNDLAHSLIALFYQLVVNDWWILMEAVVVRVGEQARVFFVSFYCISVLIVFSVCTAFVVEAYMDLHEAKVEKIQKVKGATASLTETIPIPNMPQPVSLAPGLAREANAIGSINTALRPSVAATGNDRGDESTGLRQRGPSQLKTSKSFRQFHQAVHQRASVGSRQSIAGGAGGAAANGSSNGAPISRPPSGSLAMLRAQRTDDTPLALAQGSGAAIPDNKIGVATEALLLSRIRDRASSMGLRVKLKPTGGMFNTLKNMFQGDLPDAQEEDEEETEDTEDEH